MFSSTMCLKSGMCRRRKRRRRRIDRRAAAEARARDLPPCGICLDPPVRECSLPCGHGFCKQCLEKSAVVDMDSNRLTQCPSCMVDGVKTLVPADELLQHGLAEEVVRRAYRFELRWALRDSEDVRYCDVCEQPFLLESGAAADSCPYCGDNPRQQQDETAELKFATYRDENGTIACNGCGEALELKQACNKPKCRCGTLNCWVCGARLEDNPYAHFGESRCPLFGGK